MEQKDRVRIQRNIVNLSNNVTDLNALYKKLLERGVIFQSDLERLERNYPVRQEQAQEFFLRYTKRGPHAFGILVEVLRLIGYGEEADALERDDDDDSNTSEIRGQSSTNARDVIPSQSPSGSSSNISTSSAQGSPILGIRGAVKMEDLPPLVISVRKATLYNMGAIMEDAYPMMSDPRGYALIINNIEFPGDPSATRTGAAQDSENLELLFESLHFRVTSKLNATKQEILSAGGIVDEFIEKFGPEDCCIVAVMSHGKEGYFITSDPAKMNDVNVNRISIWEEFLPKFNNRNCPQLRGKPKIFIVQACRGEVRDRGVVQKRRISSTMPDSGAVVLEERVETERLPSFEDMLICQSTVPGYVSNRDTEKGTWYIECLCRVFCECAHEMELTRMLKKVGLLMRCFSSEFGEKQMCSYVDTGFHYELYFNPGIFQS